MSKRPYANARRTWLKEQSAFFDDVLTAAGHMQKVLQALQQSFSPGGEHILDFADLKQSDVDVSDRVCRQLMTALGPTAKAMRDELKERQRALCETPSRGT